MSKKIYTEDEVKDVAKKVLADDLAEIMKQIGDKYNDLAEDKAQNEIYNANKEIERNYPENGVISIVLHNGELTLPYQVGSKIRFTFTYTYPVSEEDTQTVLEYEVNDVSKVDIKEVIASVDGNPILEIETYTPQEVTFYNQELFDKEKKVEREVRIYERTYYGVCNAEEVTGMYLVVGKFK